MYMSDMMQRLLFLALAASACGDAAATTPDGGPDAGAPTDAALATLDDGGIAAAPDRVWTWIPVAAMRCMDGSPTGFGVNLARSSRRLLLVLEGGGACFDDATCAFGTINAQGFGPSEFQTQVVASIGQTGAMNRANPDNPFAGWSYVFVPYCTGDIHAGANPTGAGGRQFVGYANVGEVLARVVPALPVDEVVLAGSSAGGFGAAYNYDRAQRAFGQTPVLLVDDSGPVLPDAYLKPCLQARFRATWNLAQTLPADCTDCTLPDGGGLENLARYVARKYPTRRAGIVSSTWDAVIRSFFSAGYSSDCKSSGYFPPTDYEAGLVALRQDAEALDPAFHMFLVPSESHTWLMNEPLGATIVNGTSLTDWLRGLVDGGPGWQDVSP